MMTTAPLARMLEVMFGVRFVAAQTFLLSRTVSGDADEPVWTPGRFAVRPCRDCCLADREGTVRSPVAGAREERCLTGLLSPLPPWRICWQPSSLSAVAATPTTLHNLPAGTCPRHDGALRPL